MEQGSAPADAQPLEEHLHRRVERLQLALARLLDAIDAPAGLRGSDGYRPRVGALEAGDTRTITLPCGRSAWVGEADRNKFGDPIEPDWMVRMVAERLEDGALRRPGLFQRLNATRRGDDHAYGVQGNAASLQEVFNKALRLLVTWLKRRRPRHSETWPGDTAVREHFPVARPRIGGRPQTRPAAIETSADLRTRVFLKSPVRDNRTPGSVRGPSGNWPSYRDGLRANTREDRWGIITFLKSTLGVLRIRTPKA